MQIKNNQNNIGFGAIGFLVPRNCSPQNQESVKEMISDTIQLTQEKGEKLDYIKTVGLKGTVHVIDGLPEAIEQNYKNYAKKVLPLGVEVYRGAKSLLIQALTKSER